MKKILVFALSLLLSMSMFSGVFAAENYVVDNGGAFTAEETAELNEKFAAIEEKYDVSIFFAIDYSLPGGEIVDYANDVLKGTTASTGVALVMNSEYYYIETTGAKADVVKTYSEYLWNTFYSSLTYYGGASAFGEAVSSIVGEKKGDLPVINSVPVLDKKASVVDMANLLSDSEEQSLAQKIADVSARQNLEVVVVTTNSLGGLSAKAYADDFYDYNGYGKDGVLFLVSMEDRDWAISTKGYGVEVLTDYGQNYITSKVLPRLSDGDFYKAFASFVDYVDEFATEAKNDKPYDINNTKKSYPAFFFVLCPALGLIVAAAYVGGLRSQLKSVHTQRAAGNYIVPGSLNITRSRDFLVSRNVVRTPRPEKETSSEGSRSSGGSSVHISSSGSFHGGSSGKF